jgi:hypothetical protein
VDRAGEVEVEVGGAGEDASDEGGGSVGRRGANGAGEGCMRVGFISRMGAGSLCKAGIVDAVATWEKEPQGFGLLADVMAGVIPR